MPATPPPSPKELSRYPTMTGWFDPRLLAKLLLRVIVSDLFGQYADRRLILAALDPVGADELAARARKFMPGQDSAEVWTFTPDESGAVWVDFIADLGDGFDATFAIASLLAMETLSVDGTKLPRGQLLVMGGDEIYPTATREAYRKKLRDPYDWAFPDPHPGLLKGPPVYAIPGNHDWYDGLVQFLALFSRREHLHLGGWRTHQRRSYFALQLTPTWWIWGIDAQLGDDIDQPQKDYFVAIAKSMPEGSNLILCAPEPGWQYTLKQGRSLSVTDYVAWLAVEHCKGVKIPLVLSGDTHHYSRYVGDDGTQFVTSGGGGAFLHPTHQLADTVNIDRPEDGITWLGGRVKTLTLAERPASDPKAAPEKACYPSRSESRRMLAGNLAFPVYNPGFAVILGVIYWLLGIIAVNWDFYGVCLALVILCVGFLAYTRKQEGGGAKVNNVSIANGVIHAVALVYLANAVSGWNEAHFQLPAWPHDGLWLFLIFAVEMIVIGGVVAAELFGIYLASSSALLNLNHNDAFSSMRRDSHRHILRMRLTANEATLYPIGLDRVPRRHEWRRNDAKRGSPAPAFVPAKPLMPRLIEPPILIRVSPTPPPPGPRAA
jgi:hypothetical protein